MSSFFPTFGVLMYTFIVAGKDMIIFISVLIIFDKFSSQQWP